MTKPGFSFELLHVDKNCGARLGRLSTPHGDIELPAFMPVGTCGTVKGLTTDLVETAGSQILLGNTYHLALRPGAEVVAELGGLHQFMGWDRPILTDSGGFQLFSLAQLTKITDHGATFRSHIDGSPMELSPERSVEIQEQLGSDIAMVLDHLIQLPSSQADIEDANARTVRWAERCKRAHKYPGQIQFGIVQGGLDPKMRVDCARQLKSLDFPGYAIGGLSVGEPPEDMYRTIDVTTPELPTDRPRYLMGVGTPRDLLESVRRGVDMFDCVMPTRAGRHGLAYTRRGKVNLKNARHADDPRPLDAESTCPATRDYSRAYLHHLTRCNEALGAMLLSWNNLHYYQTLMQGMRDAIEQNQFAEFTGVTQQAWAAGDIEPIL